MSLVAATHSLAKAPGVPPKLVMWVRVPPGAANRLYPSQIRTRRAADEWAEHYKPSIRWQRRTTARNVVGKAEEEAHS